MIKVFSEFILNETLKTHDIDFTLSDIDKELSLMRIFDFKLQKINNTFEITLNNFNFIYNVEEYLDYLDSLVIDRHGWFPTTMKIKYLSLESKMFPYDEDFLINNVQYIKDAVILYEAKFDLKSETVPEFVYHLSFQEYHNNIMKNGLIPKSKSKLSKHLDRIYLCYDPQDCLNLISRMKLLYKIKMTPRNKMNLKWIIYKIDTKGLNFNMYKDPNYSNGFYVIDNIPNKNITVFSEEK